MLCLLWANHKYSVFFIPLPRLPELIVHVKAELTQLLFPLLKVIF